MRLSPRPSDRLLTLTVAGALALAVGVGTAPARAATLAPSGEPRPLTTRQFSMADATVRPVTKADGPSALRAAAATAPAGSQLSPGDAPEEVLQTTKSAPLVALTWARSAVPQGAAVAIRGRTASGWGPWTALEVDLTQDPAAPQSGRVGTDPLWLGEGVKEVQVRYGQDQRARVRQARMELIDPGVKAADTTPQSASALIASAAPNVITRAGWGADESLRNCSPSYSQTTKGAVLHHTAGTNSYTASQSAGIVRGVYAYHTNSLGWCDIGYNMLVDKYGQVFEGRYGRLDRPVIGAHALGFNTDTFGVSVLGSYDGTTPTAAALNAVSTAMAWRLRMFYVGANARTTLVSADSGSRYPKGTAVNLPVIIGHRDVNTTACPGNQLWTRQASLRTSTAAKQDYTASTIYKRWMALGGAGGRLGTVSRGEAMSPIGYRTIFNGGSLWIAGGATHELSHVFSTYYEDLGGPANWGRPTGSSSLVGQGQRMDTVGGYTITWAPNIGTRRTNGALRTYWLAQGGPTGALGFPRTEMSMPTSAGYVQDFAQGAVYYKYAVGAHAVTGPILTHYRAVGGPTSAYGYATGDTTRVGTGWTLATEGGHIWNSAKGTFGTRKAIDTYYVGRGGATSPLGFPVASHEETTTHQTQRFENGLVTYDKATGKFTVS